MWNKSHDETESSSSFHGKHYSLVVNLVAATSRSSWNRATCTGVSLNVWEVRRLVAPGPGSRHVLPSSNSKLGHAIHAVYVLLCTIAFWDSARMYERTAVWSCAHQPRFGTVLSPPTHHQQHQHQPLHCCPDCTITRATHQRCRTWKVETLPPRLTFTLTSVRRRPSAVPPPRASAARRPASATYRACHWRCWCQTALELPQRRRLPRAPLLLPRCPAVQRTERLGLWGSWLGRRPAETEPSWNRTRKETRKGS